MYIIRLVVCSFVTVDVVVVDLTLISMFHTKCNCKHYSLRVIHTFWHLYSTYISLYLYNKATISNIILLYLYTIILVEYYTVYLGSKLPENEAIQTFIQKRYINISIYKKSIISLAKTRKQLDRFGRFQSWIICGSSEKVTNVLLYDYRIDIRIFIN